MKAFLIYNNIQPKKIHDLYLLLTECIKIDNEFIQYDDSILLELSDCSVFARYDEIEEIDREFIKSTIPTVLELKVFVEKKISVKLL